MSVAPVRTAGRIHGVSEPELRRTLLQVDAAKAGDRDALEELFARYGPRVRTVVRFEAASADPSAIEDLVQESLLKAFERIDQFEAAGPDSFRHWIARIAVNQVRDRYRHDRRAKRGGGRVRTFSDAFSSGMGRAVPGSRMPTPSEVASGHEAEEELRAALEQLSARHREVILQRDFLGRSHDEIAAELGYRSAVPVRALYHRARARLQALLG